MGQSTFDETHPFLTGAEADSAWGTVETVIAFPPALRSWRIDTLTAYSTDTVDHVVEFGIIDSDDDEASRRRLACVTVPAGAGNGTVAICDCLAALLPTTSPGFWLTEGYQVWVRFLVAISAEKAVHFMVIGGEL